MVPVSIYQQNDAAVLTAEVPGVQPESLDLTVLNDSVTLTGRREEDQSPPDSRFYRRKRPAGAFSRTVALPDAIDPNSVKAEYRNGILRVQMAKAEKARPRKIKIEATQ